MGISNGSGDLGGGVANINIVSLFQNLLLLSFEIGYYACC